MPSILIILFLFLFAALITIYTPKIKGWIGEKEAAANLSGLPEGQYKILHDVMLRTSYGTTQIDYVVVSVYGIFVIEIKNYKGRITGGAYSEQWIQNIYGKKYSFQNPLKQNYAHVKALEEKLALSEDKFIPIVAFSEDGDIKVKAEQPVISIGNLKSVILACRDIKFKEKDLDRLAASIRRLNVTEKETKKQHVQQIRRRVAENEKKLAKGICPKCGGQLVERKGRYGAFLGCSNYPRCRYTKKEGKTAERK